MSERRTESFSGFRENGVRMVMVNMETGNSRDIDIFRNMKSGKEKIENGKIK
jgi:hypothetical protein